MSEVPMSEGRICPRCGLDNSPVPARPFCGRCRAPMEPDHAAEQARLAAIDEPEQSA